MKKVFGFIFIALIAVLTAATCFMLFGCGRVPETGGGESGGTGNVGGGGSGTAKEETFVSYVLDGFVCSVTGQEDCYIDINDMSETDHATYDVVILMYGKHIEISERKIRFKDGTTFAAIGDMDYTLTGDSVSVSEPSVALAFNYIKLSDGIFSLGVSQSVGAYTVTYRFEYYSPNAVTPSYTVSFDSVGGSEVGSKTVKRGGTVERPVDPEKGGYTFLDWYIDENYSNIWDFETKKVLANVSLYAKWQGERNIVTFESNDENGTSFEQTVYSGNRIYAPSSPKKTGYKFVGWYSDYDLTQEWDFSTEITQSMTLYAKYEANTYTVTFDVMGGSCDVSAKEVKYKEAVGELPMPTRSGFEFGGWCERYNYSRPYTEDTVYGLADDRTLYAKWQAKITLDTDGLGSISKTEVTGIYGVMQLEAEDIPDPTCDGAAFVGWYTQPSGKGNEYTRYSYPTDGPITLYAAWRLDVSYDSTGGNSVSDSTVIRGDSYTLPTTTRTGYTFGGWYDDEGNKVDGTTKICKNSAFTLTARWTANKITFRFDARGGTCSETTKEYVYDSPLGQLPVTEKSGNVFGGWLTAAGKQYDADSICDFSYTVTLYAKWIADVIFEYEGATSGNTTEKLSFVYKTDINVSLPEPYRTGWSFEGWFTQLSGGGTQLKNTCIVAPDSAVWSFEGNTRLYAYWVKGTDKRKLTYKTGDYVTVTGLSDSTLTELEIPEIIDLKPVRVIGANAFRNTGITKAVVTNSVTQIDGSAFGGCQLTEISLPFVGKSANAANYEGVFGYIFDYVLKPNQSDVVDGAIRQIVDTQEGKYYWYYIPSTIRKVTLTKSADTLHESAFRNCRMLEEIVLPGGTVTVGEYGFGACTNLTSVVGLDSVTSVGKYAFYGCTNLPSFPTSPLLGVGDYAFYNCGLLTEITFGDGLKEIGEYAFVNTGITSIVVPDSAEYIGYSAFNGCRLTEMTVPFIGKRKKTVYNYDNVLGAIFGMKRTEGGGDFSGMTYQMSSCYFYIPATLKKVTVTGNAALPEYAFNNCAMLEEINLVGTSELNEYALSGCTNLKTIRFGSAVPQINHYSVTSGLNKNATVVVPDEYVENYKAVFTEHTVIGISEESL